MPLKQEKIVKRVILDIYKENPNLGLVAFLIRLEELLVEFGYNPQQLARVLMGMTRVK